MSLNMDAALMFDVERDRVIKAFDDLINPSNDDIYLDFGCGKNRKEDFLGADIFQHENIDLIHNIDQNGDFPIGDNTVHGIRAIHSVEHVGDWVRLWNEFYRICCHNALLYIVVPHPSCSYYFQDPSHQTFYTEVTFEKYLSGKYIEIYSDYGLRCKFKAEIVQVVGPSIDKLSIHCILRTIKEEEGNENENEKE